jgi:cellulose synthase/poly-beta-1,6-N-acetylglucosamine synthase-like glycosyltransferase
MKDIEIPYVKDRGRRYRFFEMLPGLLSWSILLLPLVLSLISPIVTVFFIIAYMLLWFTKAVGLNIRVLQGWKLMQQHQKLDWAQLLEELEAGEVQDPRAIRPKWHYSSLLRLQVKKAPVKPSELIHAIIIATYNESREVLEPTIQSVLNSDYDMSKVMLVLAYEERGGPAVEKQAHELMASFEGKFMKTMAVKHPKDIPGEVVGKGGNITHAGRELKKYLEDEKIDPVRVVVTTLDSDNRPHPKYLAALSYTFCVSPDPVRISFQPIPLFTNNIWDAPAPMRVIATGNSFWMIIQALRPHILRNFSAHAQSMQALIDTDFWSVRTIVEDGHQFWRTYFRYEGRHEVYPILIPIYQDAVFAGKYRKTLKAQFVQLRRWAWGASDVAYVAEKGFFTKNRIPKLDMTFKFLRLLEGHVSWATAPLILAFSAFVPQLLNPKDFAANQLPFVASNIQRLAMLGIFTTLYLSLKALPPKPKRYKSHRSLFMVLQWIYLPLTTIGYAAMSALYSQTRLILGKYLDKFDVTDKAVVTEDKDVILGA